MLSTFMYIFAIPGYFHKNAASLGDSGVFFRKSPTVLFIN